MHTVRVVVSGHVQGVGFRYYVKQVARELGLRGSVWNTSTGNVEAHFGHPDLQVLDLAVRELWSGPGRVESVIRFEEEIILPEPEFSIGPTV